MDSNAKGSVAELEIAAAAVRLGVPVLKPLTERGRYDLVFEIGRRLLRVQCKWAGLAEDRSTIKVRMGGSRCTPNGYVLSSYAVDEIDLLAAYCGELDRCSCCPTPSSRAGARSPFDSHRLGTRSAHVLTLRRTTSSLGL